jgi:spore coat polysaccharide biosynthesis protein SpsF
MNYGAVNRMGQPSREQALTMIRRAVAEGVSTVDTARDYGTAEALLGQLPIVALRQPVKVVTKLDPLRTLPSNAGEETVRAAVDESIHRSCEALQVERLDVLLLHRWEHRMRWNGGVWARLLELKDNNKIGVLGASVYEPAEAMEALRDPNVQHLQIPFNLLDWRWHAAGIEQAIADRPDLVVHARSALLQGILVHSQACWPAVEGFDAGRCIKTINLLVESLQRQSITDLCFAYVRAQSWIHGVVVGCETMTQLEENLKLFSSLALDTSQCAQVEWSLPRSPDTLLNPVTWRQFGAASAS